PPFAPGAGAPTIIPTTPTRRGSLPTPPPPVYPPPLEQPPRCQQRAQHAPAQARPTPPPLPPLPPPPPLGPAPPQRTASPAPPPALPRPGKTALLPQHRLNHRILQIPPSADNCRQLHSGGQPLGMDIHRHPTSSQGNILRRYHFQERHLSGPVTVVRHPLVLLRQLQQRRLLFGLLAEDLQGRQHIFQLPQAVDHRLPIEGRLLFVPGHGQFQGSAALATVQQGLGQARAQ